MEYKNNFDDFVFEKIILKLNGLIKSYVGRVDNYYKDDFEQELLIGVFKVLKTFKIDYDIINSFDLNNLSKENNVICFNKKYGDEFFCYCITNNNLHLFLNELILFCNENQLISYTIKTFNNTYFDYLRKFYHELNGKIINLDDKKYRNYEIIDNSYSSAIAKFTVTSKYKFKEDDLKFLELFIEGDKLLSEKEVGMKLGISQQAINKRKKKICKKYKVE